MTPGHDPALVALSLVMAFQGSYVGLQLARGIQAAAGLVRRRQIALSALALALGIWTMHFVGMLAVRLPLAVDFLVLPTLLSFLVCVLVVGVAVVFVGLGRQTHARIALAALFMGGGIVSMHYIGMLALHAGMHPEHSAAWVAASIVIGIAASGAALWLGFGDGARRSLLLSAATLALAIAAMHYTAMAGTRFGGHTGAALDLPTLSPGLLAVIVSLVAFVVSGLFLLTLVPMAPPPPVATPAPPPGPARTLPIEADGLRRTLDIARLVAVQADGHYTRLFDGERTWFCPMAITQVESLLDPAHFARVHRSHIVHLDRIARLKRQGDAGVLSLATSTPYDVPVARARRSWVQAQLRQRTAP